MNKRERKPTARTITHSARLRGILNLDAAGNGKSRLNGRGIAWQDFMWGYPQVIIDNIGPTADNFLDKVLRFLQYVPPSQHSRFLDRIVYVDMGSPDIVMPFPIYYRLGTERSLREIAERYPQVILKNNPSLFTAQVQGWPPLHEISVMTGMVLTALDRQITQAQDLLRHPEDWERTGRFAEASKRCPEVAPAVAFFRNDYLPLRPAERRRLTNPFFERIFSFTLDKHLRALFGANSPGINWNEVAEKGQTVIVDFRRELDSEMRRFKLLWVFSYLYEWIKIRGRSQKPFGVLIDEFPALTQKVVAGENPLAKELDEFIQQYMRQHQIWLTVTLQSPLQLDEQLQQTVLSLGTYIIGQAPTIHAARLIADAIAFLNPYSVKHYRKVWARQGYPGYTSPLNYFVLDVEPEYMPLSEQQELFAQRIKNLPLFEFVIRPAESEGHIGSVVLPLSIRHIDRGNVTGEYQFPDQNLLPRFCSVLAMQSGIPVATVLKEQEQRLLPAAITQGARPKPPQRKSDVQAGHGKSQRTGTEPMPADAETPDTSPAQDPPAPPRTPPAPTLAPALLRKGIRYAVTSADAKRDGTDRSCLGDLCLSHRRATHPVTLFQRLSHLCESDVKIPR